MAQATTADSTYQEDPSLTGEDATQGKTSMFGKLRNKTKDKTSKLKAKLKPGSKSTGEEVEEDSSSSSSDDEANAPVHNAFSGVTQPKYDQQSENEKPASDTKGSTTAPAQNFPGNFAGIAGGESKEEDSGLSKDFQGLSTNDKDESMESQPAADEVEDSAPVTQKLQETKDETVDKFSPSGTDSSSDNLPVTEQAQQVGDKATEAGKSWTQWAAEKVGYAKDTAAAKAPTTAEGKPVHEEAYGAAVGAKDSAVAQAAATKDSLASQIPDRSSIPSDPAQQTYVQKATGGMYGAKDKLYTSTQPGEHDKALSQKVTEAVGNLPATIKASLGYGAKTGGVSSPSNTPSPSDTSLSPSEPSVTPPQSPGLVNRITGLFSSKKAVADNSKPSSESTVSEAGPETQTPVSE